MANGKPKDKELHIECVRNEGILLDPLHFQDHLKGQVVMVCSDNATAVDYLNKQGDKILPNSSISLKNLGLGNIPGGSSQGEAHTWSPPQKKNKQKKKQIHGRLSIQARQSAANRVVSAPSGVQKSWHTPQLDMFATWQNLKLPWYVAPMPDPRACQVDALSIPWNNLDGYVYAPVAIIPKVIQEMHAFPCRMIVVAPGWPGMPWFWDLLSLSIRPSLKFPLWNKLLKQPHNQLFHSNLEFLILHAWLLESRKDSHLGSPPMWKRELELLREPHLEPYTPQGGPYMGIGANRTRWTSSHHLFLK